MTKTPAPCTPCCVPRRDVQGKPTRVAAGARRIDARPQQAHLPKFVRIDACTFTMGAADVAAHPFDGEGPVRAISLEAYEIGAYAVTNVEYAAFHSATNYRTEAEVFGWSFVFDAF